MSELRSKRQREGIPGRAVCNKTGINRSRLSDIERGYVTASPEELARINTALDELISAKKQISALAAELGWPSVAL